MKRKGGGKVGRYQYGGQISSTSIGDSVNQGINRTLAMARTIKDLTKGDAAPKDDPTKGTPEEGGVNPAGGTLLRRGGKVKKVMKARRK